MHTHVRMKSLVPALAVLGLAVSVPAHAGTYLGAGIGTQASVEGSLGNLSTEGQHSGRVVIGQRFGIFSIEGGVNDYGLTSSAGTVQWHAIAAGAAGKLDLPFTALFNGYVRLGLEHTWVTSTRDTIPTLEGNGWTGSLGLEYRLDALLGSASIWADYGRHTVNLNQARIVGETTANMFTVGLTVGL